MSTDPFLPEATARLTYLCILSQSILVSHLPPTDKPVQPHLSDYINTSPSIQKIQPIRRNGCWHS